MDEFVTTPQLVTVTKNKKQIGLAAVTPTAV